MSVQWQAPQQDGTTKNGSARRAKSARPAGQPHQRPPRTQGSPRWVKPLAGAVVLALLVFGAVQMLNRPAGETVARDGVPAAGGAGDEAPASSVDTADVEAGGSAGDATTADGVDGATADAGTDEAHDHAGEDADAAGGEGAAAGSGGQTAPILDLESIESSYLAATAVTVSRQIFPEGNADELVLIRDVASGDALAAGSLIGLFNTTFLITGSDTLPAVTAEEIDRLGTPRVHLLGGTTAISESIVQQLEAAGHDVHRHAGPVQADTAVDIATRHFPEAQTAVLIRTPDLNAGPVDAIASALAATTLAASQEMPILLTGSADLTQSTAEYLAGSSVRRVIVVGNEDEISTEVTSSLRRLGVDWTRWGGANRFENAVEIAVNRGFETLSEAEVVVLVEGGHDSVWPAGMLGAVLAANENGPVLLTRGDQLPKPTAEFLSAGGSSVDIICTPGVTQQACAQAKRLVGAPSP